MSFKSLLFNKPRNCLQTTANAIGEKKAERQKYWSWAWFLHFIRVFLTRQNDLLTIDRLFFYYFLIFFIFCIKSWTFLSPDKWWKIMQTFTRTFAENQTLRRLLKVNKYGKYKLSHLSGSDGEITQIKIIFFFPPSHPPLPASALIGISQTCQ